MRRVSRHSSVERMTAAMRREPQRSVGSPNRKLLGAAATLFRTSGYTAATTRQLARRLGIRSASLYYHIGKKEDLLYEISVVCLERIEAAVATALAATPDPVDRVRVLVATHCRVALSDTDWHLTMLVELRSLSRGRRAHVVALRDRYEKLVRRVIADAQAAGALRTDIPQKYLALALLNLVNWSIFWYRPRGGLSVSALGALLAQLFLDGARGTPR